MRRRQFLGLAASATCVGLLPHRALAQPAGVPRVAVLMALEETDLDAPPRMAAFMQGLAENGFIPGDNLVLDIGWSGGVPDRVTALAQQLLATNPDVLITASTGPTRTVQAMTTTVPVVFVYVSDPLGSGFVSSFARPGGNITGFTNLEPSLGGKWVEIVKEAAPSVVRATLLYNPAVAPGRGEFFYSSFEAASAALGVETLRAPVADATELTAAIAGIAAEPGGALLTNSDAFTVNNRVLIMAEVARHRLPAIYPFTYFVREGGMLSYGIDTSASMRQAAGYVRRIIDGASPADLPVQAPSIFELGINLRTAAELGYPIPSTLLARADIIVE